jgi:sugar phosphate isomerase/epimerase
MNRRQFIQSGAALSLISVAGFEAFAGKKNLKNFGCQLYSVRDKMSKDPIATMRALAEMGYTQFESYSKDPYWGMNPTEAKAFFKEIGVNLVSSHMGVPDISDESVAKAKEVGVKYLLSPYIGAQKSAEEWSKRAEEFNKAGELCNKYGIKFGYHNHGYSFETKDGVKGQDILLKETDPKLVVFELDIYWAEVAGENAIKHFEKYKGRYELCHVKQLISRDPKPAQGVLKGGLLDFQKILVAAKKNGVKYFMVEQEQYAGDSLDAMKENAAYMKTLKL